MCTAACLRGASVKAGCWLMLWGSPRHLLSLKSNLINAHRDALKANHLSVNSVAVKKANKLFLPPGNNLWTFPKRPTWLLFFTSYIELRFSIIFGLLSSKADSRKDFCCHHFYHLRFNMFSKILVIVSC